MDDLEMAARRAIEISRSSGIEAYGPVATEYGFGWEPTVTVWTERRRIHLRWGLLSGTRGDERVAELVELADRKVVVVAVASGDLAGVAAAFLAGESHGTLPVRWLGYKSSCDNLIPHPPSETDPGNIVGLVGDR